MFSITNVVYFFAERFKHAGGGRKKIKAALSPAIGWFASHYGTLRGSFIFIMWNCLSHSGVPCAVKSAAL